MGIDPCLCTDPKHNTRQPTTRLDEVVPITDNQNQLVKTNQEQSSISLEKIKDAIAHRDVRILTLFLYWRG